MKINKIAKWLTWFIKTKWYKNLCKNIIENKNIYLNLIVHILLESLRKPTEYTNKILRKESKPNVKDCMIISWNNPIKNENIIIK